MTKNNSKILRGNGAGLGLLEGVQRAGEIHQAAAIICGADESASRGEPSNRHGGYGRRRKAEKTEIALNQRTCQTLKIEVMALVYFLGIFLVIGIIMFICMLIDYNKNYRSKQS